LPAHGEQRSRRIFIRPLSPSYHEAIATGLLDADTGMFLQ
jgi:hypothetical protein